MNLRSFCLFPLAVVSLATIYSSDCARPIVGAIRWDGWTENSKWGNNLKPEQWHYRLPFYAKVCDGKLEVRADSQDIMDQEIMYASDAGLSYWAFCYDYANFKADAKKVGLPLYLSSQYKSKINFCVIWLGNEKELWPEMVKHLVALFKEPTYQKVLGGRPLVYRYYVETMAKQFGSEKAAKEAINYLAAEAMKAGLKRPYMVAQVWNAQDGARDVDNLGFDALSAYSMSVNVETMEQKEYPYSRLAKINHDFWNACKGTGKEVIPIVNTGWDVRPRWWDTKLMKAYSGAERPWFTKATPSEIADNVRDAIEWNRDNPTAGKANAVLIYAWNETDEGGWLVPTLSEGKARLDALRRVISSYSKCNDCCASNPAPQ